MTEQEYIKKVEELSNLGYKEVSETEAMKAKSSDLYTLEDQFGKFHYFVLASKVKPKPPVVPPVVDPNDDDPNPKPKPKQKSCPYQSTPFKNTTEGNEFRAWVRENFKDYAKVIDLSANGEFNNCYYIRKAYANVPTDYSLSLGEIYTRIKQNPKLVVSDFTTTNYPKTKEREKVEQVYTTDSKMWRDLIDKGEITKYGEIKKLSDGSAVYILRYIKGTDNVDPINEVLDLSVESIKKDLEKYEYVVLLSPSDRNAKPLKGQVGVIQIKKDVNGEDAIRVVKEKGSYWTAFKQTRDELEFSLNERIIKNILGLLVENPVQGVYRAGNTPDGSDPKTGFKVDNVVRQDGSKTTNNSKTQQTEVKGCILSPQQYKDVTDLIRVDGSYQHAMDQTQDPVSKNYSLTAFTDASKILPQTEYSIKKMSEIIDRNGGKAITQEPAISDACIIYQRTKVTNVATDQVANLEKFLSGKTLNLTTIEPEVGSYSKGFPIYSLIPYNVLKQQYPSYAGQSNLKTIVYLKDRSRISTAAANCRTAVKTLSACAAGPSERGYSSAVCEENLNQILDYKLDAYYCARLAPGEKAREGNDKGEQIVKGGFFKGQGRFWSRLGIEKDFYRISEDSGLTNSLFSIQCMMTNSACISSVAENVLKHIKGAINEKKESQLSKTIKNNLLTYL